MSDCVVPVVPLFVVVRPHKAGAPVGLDRLGHNLGPASSLLTVGMVKRLTSSLTVVTCTGSGGGGMP